MKDKKTLLFIISFLLMIGLCALSFLGYRNLLCTPENEIKENYDSIDTSSVKALEPEKIIYLPLVDNRQFTCTGLTYDSSSHSFFICNFGKDDKLSKQQASIVKTDEDFNIVSVIPIQNMEEYIDLQGITYDSKTDSIWYTTGNELINIQKNGNVISRFYCAEYDYNGLLYNASDDTFYVLCSKRYLLKIDRENNVLETYNVNYKDQDHLCFDSDGNVLISVGGGI